jgi:hypothetical protein
MPAGRERPALSGLPVGDSQLSPPRREQATPAPHRCRRLRSLFANWPVAADDGVDLAAVDGLLFQHQATNRSSASRWVDSKSDARCSASRQTVAAPPGLGLAAVPGRMPHDGVGGTEVVGLVSCEAGRSAAPQPDRRDQLHQGLKDARAFNRSPRPTLAGVSSPAWCHNEGRG